MAENQITLGDTNYPLQIASKSNLQRVVGEVIKLSQDLLVQQYRAHQPLFVNSGSALPRAQIDKPGGEGIISMVEAAQLSSNQLVPHLSNEPKSLQQEVEKQVRAYKGKDLFHPQEPNKQPKNAPMEIAQRQVEASARKHESTKKESLNADETLTSLTQSSLSWNASTIATYLWEAPEAIISEDMVNKIKLVSAYLETQGYQLEGVKADGNCFFNAFLKSYTTLSRKIPLLDIERNKVSYLREAVASYYKSKESKRGAMIQQDGSWVSSEEGGKLALFFGIPIRVITVNQDQQGSGIIDMLVFAETGKGNQEWGTIPIAQRPQEYICIVDVGGHFLWAKKK